MLRFVFVLSWAALSIGLSTAMGGFCPTDNPGEIFCEDFDTYCSPNEFPGGSGVTKGTQCAVDATLTPPTEDNYLRTVWPATSWAYPCDAYTTPCTPHPELPIPLLAPDNSTSSNGSFFASSRPYGGRFPTKTIDGAGGKKTLGDPIPQHTFKDWSTGQSNISRLTGNQFGDVKFNAVMGTDEQPLVLKFMIDSREMGGLYYASGYIELGFGDVADPLNRANTDYAPSMDLRVGCNTATFPRNKFPVVCDVLNISTRYAACPDPTVLPPPKRNAVAIGMLALTDVWNEQAGPLHCDGAKGGQSSNPRLFNGEGWYELRENTPADSTVVVKDMNGDTVDPSTLNFTQSDVASNNFAVWQYNSTIGNAGPHNWVTLTIKSTTAKVEWFKIAPTTAGVLYQITNTMDNIPMSYTGPFDSIRIGVGPGCKLASNGSWNCDSSSPRSPIASLSPQSAYTEFDDISLSGGKGWTKGGACCLPTNGGTCLDWVLPEDCASLGGTHKGGATTCSDVDVYCCPIPYADFDGDTDVDAADFASLQVCFTGTQAVSGKCSCFDRDGNGRVDMADVAAFAVCASGPGIAISGECP